MASICHRDQDIVTELKEMREEQIEDAFYRNLAFGTGGFVEQSVQEQIV